MIKLIRLIFFGLVATGLVVIGHYASDLNDTTFRNILQGAYASTLVVLLFEFIQGLRLFKRLNILNGDWEECEIKDRHLTRAIAKGKITYKGGNSLTIELSHDNRKWIGEIIVNRDYPHVGVVSWSYLPDSGQDHEFGLKDFIIPTKRNEVDKNYLFFYLLPVNHSMNLAGELRDNRQIVLSSSDYGKVVWRKQKTSR